MIQACRLQQKVFKEVSLWSDQLGILTLFCLICAPQIFAFLFWTCNNKMWVCPCLYATSPHRKPLKSFLFKRQSPWPPCHSEPVPIRLLFEEGRLQGGGGWTNGQAEGDPTEIGKGFVFNVYKIGRGGAQYHHSRISTASHPRPLVKWPDP